MTTPEYIGLGQRLDAQLDELLSGWNIFTTILAVGLVLTVLYPLVTAKDADTHPLLLSRQANISAVRHPGESAIYRSVETPHGFPLKQGLNVKAADAPAWQRGTNGDLRDVWLRAVRGPPKEANQSSPRLVQGKEAYIHTIAGSEITDHDFESMSTRINIIGQHFQQSTRVALYLPNCLELLLALFAGAFYGFSVVLLPYEESLELLIQNLQQSQADALIAGAGHFSANKIRQECPRVTGEVMWVVPLASRHLSFGDAGENTTTWHELVAKQYASSNADLPKTVFKDQDLACVVTVHSDVNSSERQIVEFEQKHVIAAVSAQLTALPVVHRLANSDLFLPAEPLTNITTLVMTLTALFSNASVALTTSVVGPDSLSNLSKLPLAPTVIAASAAHTSALYQSAKLIVNSSIQRYIFSTQLAEQEKGYMSGPSLMTNLFTPALALLGSRPGRLRLLHVTEQARAGAHSPLLSSTMLAELRVLLDSRIVQALAVPGVAGPIAQMSLYDYRIRPNGKGHFGAPPSCVELQLRDTSTHRTVEGGAIEGEIVARGPAVVGGEVKTGISGCFFEDGTLGYA